MRNTTTKSVWAKLPLLDRLLPVWILLAMVLGILLGNYVPSAKSSLNSGSIAGVSLPIFIGLLWMMYPVLCKVRYEKLHLLISDRSAVRIIAFSLAVNVVIAPLIMTALAWICLPDLEHERTGIILVGVARCIAMVLIWNQLAGGDPEWCAILVAVNSLVQLALYGPVAYFLTAVVGGQGSGAQMVDIWLVVRSVLIFLGIPLLAAVITRLTLRFALYRQLGPAWYDDRFLPILGPNALLGLLFTIVVMFTLQGDQIIHNIPRALRTAVPLLVYFTIMFTATLAACLRVLKSPYALAVTQAFTAAGNNFELAIAVAVAGYGIDSREAFAAVIGPLIEVPALLGLVYVALALKGPYERALGGAAKEGIRMEGRPIEEGEQTMVDAPGEGTFITSKA
ncbi:hypothetical protein HK101_009375 [Irineochytrium annulatum]|nr:hypothetical protein HK101_009375 [Irineochytrium annulatum]